MRPCPSSRRPSSAPLPPLPCDPNASFCPIQPNWDQFNEPQSPYTCTTPISYRPDDVLVVRIDAQGSLCSAGYQRERFIIADNDTSSFQPAIGPRRGTSVLARRR